LIYEVDDVTQEGQKALCAMTEQNPETIKWICAANNRFAISEPLQSRMMCIDFSLRSSDQPRLHADKIVDCCLSILKREGVIAINPDEVGKYLQLNNCDMRQSLNELQARFRRLLAA
jgi:DNA polymerase III delta prime subunit